MFGRDYFKEAISFVLDIDERQILDMNIDKRDKIFVIKFNPSAKYQDPNESYDIDFTFSSLAEYFERAFVNSNYTLSTDINSSVYSATLYENDIILMSYNRDNKLDSYVNLAIWLFNKSWRGEEYFSLNATSVI